MKIMNLKERKEDAVSPVIGVMLMLVVTIVIAAVVAAFAGGIATDTEPTPSVVLTADAYPAKDANPAKVVLQSLSGDRLETAGLDVVVYSGDGTLLAKGAVPTKEKYFTPGMKLTVELAFEEGKTINAGDRIQIVTSYNDKHTVLDKEVQVKSA